MKRLLYFILWILSSSFLWATWIWSPEVGWVNTKYDPQGTARSLYAQGQKLMEQKNYEEAAQIFQNITQLYPNTLESKNALYLGATCRFYAKDYYNSYLLYEKYIESYPDAENLAEILEKEYEIGSILIRSTAEDVSILGIGISSSSSLGVEILEKLLQNTPYLKFADDARCTIANYYFKELEYKLAQESYEKLIKEYPQSEWVGFAHYQIAACHFKQFRSISYDVQPLISAKEKWEEYIKFRAKEYTKNQPLVSDKKLEEYLQKEEYIQQLEEYFQQEKYLQQDNQIQSAHQKRKEIIELLAQKELAAAKYYVDQEETRAAAIYLAYIMKKFKGTQTARQAELMMSKLKVEK